MTVSAPARLRARTVEVPGHHTPLLDQLPEGVPASEIVSWVRSGDGLLGWGRATGCMTQGPGRFADAEAWWQRVGDDAEVVDEVGAPGTGLVAFGAFSFSPGSSAGGTLVVPQVLMGRRQGRCWMTTVTNADPTTTTPPPHPPVPHPRGGRNGVGGGMGVGRGMEAAGDRTVGSVQFRDGSVPAGKWRELVAAAVQHIQAGEVDKVVLARDVLAECDRPIDLRSVLGRLIARYGATWSFAVDGLVGATPEMLVRLQEGVVRSRVLAGTMRRDTQAPSLLTRPKELAEHAFAMRSVVEALGPHCTQLSVPDEPFVLELPDVYHLATDLSGKPLPGVTSLRLAETLHPSAAVCGTPTAVAAAMIEELEQMDRGRYAGPVGWLDSAGDGDWGIALRCGQLSADGHSMRLFAGAGIVAASDPDAELAETQAKLAAMRHALGEPSGYSVVPS